MRQLVVAAGAGALAAAVSGCAGMGDRDFACPGHPGKPLCLPTSEIYRLTDGGGPPPATMTVEPRQRGSSGGTAFFPERTP